MFGAILVLLISVLRNFASAERAFRHAIALDASHAASHTNLGNALISVLQPEEALLHLERVWSWTRVLPTLFGILLLLTCCSVIM